MTTAPRTAARKTLIAGNWKMNGLQADGLSLAQDVVEGAGAVSDKADLLVCPPHLLVAIIAEALKGTPVMVGAQDCHAAEKGAHTGDVSAAMVADTGAGAVILGHSERRTDHGETNELVRAKAEAAHGAGLLAVICVGETEAERDAGETMAVNAAQVAGSLPDGATAANTVIAYEPVWAIGTGNTATAEDAQTVHAFIRGEVEKRFGAEVAGALRILYGGSMKPGNAAELLAQPDIDGGLIGGASLKAEDFLGIAACA
ncbi:MAG: triose-phosphate isomerase [Magnetovibrionaceae bacterium]